MFTYQQNYRKQELLAMISVIDEGVETSHACGPVLTLKVDEDRCVKIWPNGDFYASKCDRRWEHGNSWSWAAEKNKIPDTWKIPNIRK